MFIILLCYYQPCLLWTTKLSTQQASTTNWEPVITYVFDLSFLVCFPGDQVKPSDWFAKLSDGLPILCIFLVWAGQSLFYVHSPLWYIRLLKSKVPLLCFYMKNICLEILCLHFPCCSFDGDPPLPFDQLATYIHNGQKLSLINVCWHTDNTRPSLSFGHLDLKFPSKQLRCDSPKEITEICRYLELPNVHALGASESEEKPHRGYNCGIHSRGFHLSPCLSGVERGGQFRDSGVHPVRSVSLPRYRWTS